jgi:hypothetical protein
MSQGLDERAGSFRRGSPSTIPPIRNEWSCARSCDGSGAHVVVATLDSQPTIEDGCGGSATDLVALHAHYADDPPPALADPRPGVGRYHRCR